MRTDRFNFLIAAMTGTLFAAVFRFLTFKYEDSPIGINTLGNIKAYLILAVLWLGVFYLVSVLLEKALKKDLPKPLKIAFTAASFAGILFTTYELFEVSGYTALKHIVVMIPFTVGLAVLNSCIKGDRLKKLKTVFLWAETGALAIVWYLTSATVNTFSHYSFGRSYNVYHSSAYIDTILNTYYGVPFTGIESELYGHYSLILMPFLKIFGMNTKTIGIILGLLTAIAFALLCACIIMTVKSFAVKVFGIGGFGIFGVTAYSIYWQSFPHRMIFPSIAIFILTLCAYKKWFSKKVFFIGLILPALALIWNTESGAVVAVVWALYGAEAFGATTKIHKLLCFIISLPISVGASLLGALAILNIYNLSAGGEKMGPMELVGFQAKGFVGDISKDLESGNALYVHIFVMLFICAVWAVYCLYIKREDNPKAMFALALAATGLGMGTYYVNNPSGGSGILSMYFMLAATIILSGAKISRDPYDLSKTLVAIYAALALFYGGLQGRILLPQINSHRNAGAYDYQKFRDFTKDLDSRIAPDTVGGGFGTTAVFMELGRDRMGRDFHFNMEELNNPKHFIKFCDGEDEFEGYEVVDKIFYEDVAFNYFERID